MRDFVKHIVLTLYFLFLPSSIHKFSRSFEYPFLYQCLFNPFWCSVSTEYLKLFLIALKPQSFGRIAIIKSVFWKKKLCQTHHDKIPKRNDYHISHCHISFLLVYYQSRSCFDTMVLPIGLAGRRGSDSRRPWITTARHATNAHLLFLMKRRFIVNMPYL